jgi:hypothetical protein
MSIIRYLLDENVDPALLRALNRKVPDMVVWHVGGPGAPPLGTLDPDILLWIEAEGFILVTNNRRSMPGHLRDHLEAGRHIPGILILDDDMSIGETVDELELIMGASEADEYIDQIKHLPLP